MAETTTYTDRMTGPVEPATQAVPPAAPPGAPPIAPASAGAPAPKKKRTGCLIAAIIAAVLLLGCVGAVIALGLASRADEDAAAYTEADFDSAVAKLGLVWPVLPEGADPAGYERVYSGQKQVDVTLTEAELSALMSFHHAESYWPIKSMEVDLQGGDSASASMVVTYAGRDWPVEASGSGGVSGDGLEFSIASATVAGFDVPAEYLPVGADFLESVVNPRLARAGISIQGIEITDDGVRFVGTTWESAEYVPVQ